MLEDAAEHERATGRAVSAVADDPVCTRLAKRPVDSALRVAGELGGERAQVAPARHVKRRSTTGDAGSRAVRRVRDRTTGIAENAFTTLEPRWCRRPATCQPAVEELACRWLVIPHGDRRDPAHSRRIEDEDEPLTPRHDHVVGVFVLRDDVPHEAGRLLRAEPFEHGAERSQTADRQTEAPQLACGYVTDRFNSHLSHRDSPPNEESATR